MTALRKIIEENTAVVTTVPAPKLYVVNGGPAEVNEAGEEKAPGTLKNIVLFFAAPFIGLAYVIALPFVGLALLAVFAARTAAKYEAVRTAGLVAKNVAMIVAAPVLGLAYFVFLPVIGLGALVWVAATATVRPAR